MPELPEVETVKETLKKQVLNRVIKNVIIRYDKIITGISLDKFKEKIKNQKINDIKRRGKWLLFELDDYFLVSHLRMEGKYFINKQDDEITKHQHVIFDLDDNIQLRYSDVRKFGKMYLIKKEEINLVPPVSELGHEPFDEKLTIEYLKDKYKNKSMPIKTSLLDQSIIVGIGNIYADEILFLSKINPYKKCNELNDLELQAIINNTKTVLTKAIKLGGSTIRSYTSSDGSHGRFQNELLVHTKTICPICKTIIKKDKINGRGTYYCINCQKEN